MDSGGEKNPLVEQVIQAANVIEQQVDAVIEKLDDLDTDELSKIRRDRLAALRKEMKFKDEWLANGHGEYSTLTNEKEFFETIKKSERVVLHCYLSSTIRCPIVDKHLEVLARKHVETKFCRLDVEKAPFLTQRLGIKVIPTILLCSGGQKVECIVGFDDFGGIDDFPTEIIEWRIAKSGLINYDGDLTSPPDPVEARKKKRSIFTHVKKNLRDAEGDDSDSDSEAEGDH